MMRGRNCFRCKSLYPSSACSDDQHPRSDRYRPEGVSAVSGPDVLFISPDSNRLSLKSQLLQYIFAVAVSDSALLAVGEYSVQGICKSLGWGVSEQGLSGLMQTLIISKAFLSGNTACLQTNASVPI